MAEYARFDNDCIGLNRKLGGGRNVQDRDWFKVEDFAAVKIYIVICFIRLHSVVSG
jgi:hypothetical protein